MQNKQDLVKWVKERMDGEKMNEQDYKIKQ